MQETKDATLNDQCLQADFFMICEDLITPSVHPVDCPKPLIQELFSDSISSIQYYDELLTPVCCYGDLYSSKQAYRRRCDIEGRVKSVYSRGRMMH